jgi:hypothetical protein
MLLQPSVYIAEYSQALRNAKPQRYRYTNPLVITSERNMFFQSSLNKILENILEYGKHRLPVLTKVATSNTTRRLRNCKPLYFNLFYACRTMNTANSSGVLIECVARFAC